MPRLDSIIDLSHHQAGSIDFQALKELGIAAVIHKATQGTHYVDPTYPGRRRAAEAAGLLWGAYHFGEEASTGADQAASFLQTVGDAAGVFVCLDYETYFRKKDPMTPHTMSLADAHDFIDAVAQRWVEFRSSIRATPYAGCSARTWIRGSPRARCGLLAMSKNKIFGSRTRGQTGHSGNTPTASPAITPSQYPVTARGTKCL